METEIEKMLAYFGFNSLKEFGEENGFYNEIDTKRFLIEVYEEAII